VTIPHVAGIVAVQAIILILYQHTPSAMSTSPTGSSTPIASNAPGSSSSCLWQLLRTGQNLISGWQCGGCGPRHVSKAMFNVDGGPLVVAEVAAVSTWILSQKGNVLCTEIF
jgi:hypothetical protein